MNAIIIKPVRVNVQYLEAYLGDIFVHFADEGITISNKTYAKVKDNKYLTIDGTIPDNEVLQVRITVVDMSMENGSTFVIDLNLIIER